MEVVDYLTQLKEIDGMITEKIVYLWAPVTRTDVKDLEYLWRQRMVGIVLDSPH